MKFFDELKRRNVIKATMAYIVVAWVLIQVLTVILPVFQAPEWVLKTLMVLMVIGFPIWVIFSWVYEVTPEGLKKTASVSTDDSITNITNKRLNVIILVMLIIAIGVSFLNKSTPNENSEKVSVGIAPRNSIAVLPFLDMSPGKDQEFYSDGIALEILNTLCTFKELTVVARTSSFSFKNKNEDIKSIGEQLGVDHILEGSVRKQNNKILISVRLTNARDGFTVFSESYTDELENIFALQSLITVDVAKKIASNLKLEVNALRERKKTNPLAYESYLKGKLQFVNGPLNMKPGEIMKAKKYFETAVKMDSSFAEASAYLSLAYFNLADWAIPGDDILQRRIALDSAKLLAKRALSIDSLSSGAHLAMGSYYFHEYDWLKAEKAKRKAVELNPGGIEEKFILASFLAQFGQTEEALLLDQEAIKLDPLDPRGKVKYAKELYHAEKFDESIRVCNELIEEYPSLNGAYQFLGLCYFGKKEYEQSRWAHMKFLELAKQDKMAAFFRENDFQTAVIKIFDYHNNVEELPILKYNINKAIFYCYIGDKENTIKYMLEIYDHHEPQISFLRGSRFDFIKDDQRIIQLYENVGFNAYDAYKAAEKG